MPKQANPKPKPQTTIVRVAVTTAGPVSMKAVREWVHNNMMYPAFGLSDHLRWPITKVAVKRDADLERG